MCVWERESSLLLCTVGCVCVCGVCVRASARCVCACVCVCARSNTALVPVRIAQSTHIHTHTHTHTYTHIHTHTHTHRHTQRQTHTHRHTHTHGLMYSTGAALAIYRRVICNASLYMHVPIVAICWIICICSTQKKKIKTFPNNMEIKSGYHYEFINENKCTIAIRE